MQTLDTEGDCTEERFVFVWGEAESISDPRRKAASGAAGVAESADGVGRAVFEG